MGCRVGMGCTRRTEYQQAEFILIVGRVLRLAVADRVLTPDHRPGLVKARPLMIAGSAICEGCFPLSFTGGETRNILEPLDLFVGLRYDDRDGYRRAAAHQAMVIGMVESRFDEDYEEEFGFPAPGRVLFIGVELTIQPQTGEPGRPRPGRAAAEVPQKSRFCGPPMERSCG